ncbi:hypothetical protein D8M04_09595 [Oceanobacillus piezotolerans]|uniref:Uncharacterized protein n=1 Tax=Oceanobacillus piezotolerans TaxID=2448030 RepID=A0A498D906_9BACI|nr:hypothetical protein [Oceanobacillus piezotolerans]RLL45111.1 hypothetical protein D8M04_09595 [Oceanobacillus piezotolerans]
MLTFEEKLKIVESFNELARHDISLGRVNFHYPDSIYEKKIVVYHLHPNGNGFVYTEKIEGYQKNDTKGMTNIRDFSEEELRSIIQQSIASLGEKEPFQETWVNKEKQTLTIIHEFDTWDIYSGDLLDGTYTTYRAAADYLHQEGFIPQ